MPAREVSRSNLVLSDGWDEEFTVYGGRVLTVDVNAQPIMVQLSASQPPDRPQWTDPVRLAPGQWSRSRPFGHVRFRNAVAGAPASIDFYAYAE